jgi:spore coat polysaccharide biosynthesis protein SpsF
MTDTKQETEQLRFWRGEFGDSYTERNSSMAEHLRARVAMWAPIMASLVGAPPRSILEVGANVGNNLRALRQLSGAEFFALEPNAKARQKLVDDGVVPAANVRDGFAAAIDLPDGAVDLAFTSGVLIHIHPDDLLASCREIHRVAKRYVVCIEYFADKPEEIAYRGHAERLFKRDFGGFWLDSFADLRVVNYGFAWKRLTGLDNLTWWVFEKRA